MFTTTTNQQTNQQKSDPKNNLTQLSYSNEVTKIILEIQAKAFNYIHTNRPMHMCTIDL